MNEKQAEKKTEKASKKRQRVIMTYDIEAYKRTQECGTQVPFAIGVCTAFDISNQEFEYEVFYGEQSPNQFFDFLSEFNPKEKVDVYLYAHNGAKYDIAVLNEVLLKRKDFTIDFGGFIEMGGAVISLSMKNQHDIQFTFRDSARIL